MNEKYSQDEINFLRSLNKKIELEDLPYKISEYIEGRRIMPPNTKFQGPYENSRTPFAVEIMDALSPYSDTQYVDVMSAAQVVKTTIMENVIGYYIGADPSPILIVSGTGDLIEKWSTKRLEPLIDSLNLRITFHAPIENTKTRSTGDKAKQKLYSGGFVEMASAQSPASMRSDSIRILCMDECDEAPPLLSSGEGYWDEVAEARTAAWGIKRKILACSTPKEYHNSTIYRRFLLGDQCEYFVPCPRCGKFILLERGDDDTAWGLRAEKINGIFQVYYLCNECHDRIDEAEKPQMMVKGKWVPKTTPEAYRRSFHINSLLAMQGGFSWYDYWTKYQVAQRDNSLESMRSFVNLRDGMPYIASGEKPKAEKVMKNRGKYRSGEVPEGVLYLTAGVDVQRGSRKDKEDPPRVEMQVLGLGYGYRTWSVDYQVFQGDIKKLSGEGSAWQGLVDYLNKIEWKYARREDGFQFPIQLMFVDSGDGENTYTVYDWCGLFSSVYPCKGQGVINANKSGKSVKMNDQGMIPYRQSRVDAGINIYTISTILYKDKIYNRLQKGRIEGNIQQTEFCDFPEDYSDNYFKQLTAEEKLIDGTYEAYGRRNEALDTYVYALCASDVWINDKVEQLRKYYKQAGWSETRLKNEITKIWLIKDMINKTVVKRVAPE